MSERANTLGRRQALLSVGAAVGVAAVTSLSNRAEAAPSQRERVEHLLGPALADDALGGWTIESASSVVLGAIPLVMRTPEGARFHVNILRRDPAGPPAIAATEAFALYVSNRGDGATATDEAQARGVVVLRDYLARRERELVAAGIDLPEVMTLAERGRAFPDGHFSPRA